MRAPFLLILTCFTLAGFSQLTDDFTDGDFTTNPTWSGDVSKFTIDNEELRSNSNTVSDNFYLSTPSTLAQGDIEWQFRVNMKFSTSGANYTDVFLMADNTDLSAVSNGYFVRIGNTDDEVSLYKIVAGTETQLTDGTDDKTHNKNINLKVTKGAFGTWAIHADYTGGSNYQIEGSVTDNDITSSAHFGFLIKQSVASFHLSHFYDDIYVGPLLIDTQNPTILSTESLDANTIKITADEALNTASTVFTLNNGYGSPDNVTVNGNEILLTYTTALINSSYQLTIDLLGDLAANKLDTVVLFDYFIASKPKPGDLLFTEIFADPTPTIGLPEEEFFEIYNTSSEPLDLENCTFSDGGTPAVFPQVTIASQAYLILVKSGNESLFTSYGDVIELDGYPALNNSGDNLELRNANGSLLDAVNYTDDYYNDDLKKQGGYSMELIDFSTSCSPTDNWTASTDASGGTPGKQNSVLGANPDQQAPQILSVLISESNEITVTLDENIHPGLAANQNNFEIVETGSNPVNIDIDE
ncbi:lamin tail domain-containing protein, partial [Bacteroidia bacterium]|nr:lamin tail domain-containing protein [Bacteroidia bacterium]